jgi:general secretion pathway protein L
MATRTVKEKSAQRLLVFLPPRRALPGKAQLASSTVVTYVAINAGAATTQAGETPIALLPRAAAVDLVFDSADVFVTAIEAPKLSDAKMRQALPNILEDRLLSESSDLHFAFQAPSRASGSTTVAAQPKVAVSVIDRVLLTRALDVFNEIGIRPRAAYSEIYAVPAPAAAVLAVRVDRGRGIARSGRHEGFAFDLEGTGLPPPVALAVRQLGVKRVWVFGRDAAKLQGGSNETGAQIDVSQRDVDLSAADGAVNLLQGPFAQGGLFGGLSIAGLPRMTLANMKAPLIWAGVAAATFIIGMNAYFLKLETESRDLRTQMETAFRSTFPGANPLGDPGLVVLQTQRELGGLRARAGLASADDFSVLNAQLAQLLSSAPLGSVAGIEFREGALKVKFKPGTADNPGLQNALRAQAIQQGLNLRFEADGSARLTPSGG